VTAQQDERASDQHDALIAGIGGHPDQAEGEPRDQAPVFAGRSIQEVAVEDLWHGLAEL
jgi:hypothetical protein